MPPQGGFAGIRASADSPHVSRFGMRGAGCEEADVSLVAPVQVGDTVLVHAGVALVRL